VLRFRPSQDAQFSAVVDTARRPEQKCHYSEQKRRYVRTAAGAAGQPQNLGPSKLKSLPATVILTPWCPIPLTGNVTNLASYLPSRNPAK